MGLAAYSGAYRLWEWSSLVNPEEPFDRFNVGIHGLGSLDVQTAPTFPAILESIADSVRGQVIASHGPFDCNALNHAAEKYGLTFPGCRWIDTCEIARLAWPNLSSHNLETLCQHFSIALEHHNALSDAVACGEILTRAVLDTGLVVQQLITKVGLVSPSPSPGPTSRNKIRYPEKMELRGQTGGPLAGHVLVCTGAFSFDRTQLAMLAADLGCDVEDRFTKKRTTILVVGRRDPAEFNGKEKSGKQLDAEAAITEGRQVTILNEAEFLNLVDQYQER
jgi:DNA polymerase-3 subunit epsilon